jgi:hypothetical protein
MIGCVESEEGCLDPEASNFDPDADEDCCCTYPQLTLNWEYRQADTLFFAGDTIDLGTGQVVQLIDFSIIGGHVDLLIPNGRVSVAEEIAVSAFSGSEVLTEELGDDVFLLNPTRFTQTIGGYRYSGLIDGLSLSLFPQEWKTVLPSSISDGSHPWKRAEGEGLWNGNAMAMMSIEAAVDGDTITRTLFPNEDKALDWSFALLKEPSEALGLQAQLYLDVMLQNVDLKTMSDDDIVMQIIANTDSAIFVFP